MTEDMYLEANRNLSRKVTALEEELREYYVFKEMWERDQKALKEMDKRLHAKYISIRVVKVERHIKYYQKLVDVQDTPEGLYIEIA